MADAKEQFIDGQITTLTQLWLGNVLLIGIAVFLVLALMDLFVVPALFSTFLTYRIGISVILAGLFLLNKLRLDKHYQYTLLVMGTSLSAATIELMILKMGGHSSFYYAGLNLVSIAALGFIPMGLVISLVCVVSVYAIYVIPIALTDTIVNHPVFISNNAFMLSTAVIALSWRVLVQRRLVSEIGLQYDLSLEQRKLKELVDERTAMYLESESSYRSLFENATDGIIVIDQAGIVVKANEIANVIHNFSSDGLVGTNIQLLQKEQYRNKFNAMLTRVFNGENVQYETEHFRKDGTLVSLEVSASMVVLNSKPYVQFLLRDITEKKKIQEHLVQSQKMESVATLAGGIAHDLNNVLTAIIGYADIVRRKLEDLSLEKKLIDAMKMVEQASRTGARMISQLLDFSRHKKPEMLPLNINDTASDICKLLERTLASNVHIDMNLDESIPTIHGDVTNLSQAIMNLVVNARDAMPNGGIISVTTSFLPRQNVPLMAPPYVPAADYVVLKIADTGTGIPEEARSRMFEPFFTTKERGKGTGLGLAIVYSVVTSHRGYISLSSELNKGTSFTLYFPSFDNEKARNYYLANVNSRVGRSVLVIDEDEGNIAVIKRMLERESYLVTAITNPLEALDVFQTSRDDFSLVIASGTLPLLRIDELTRRILEIKPEQKIAVITESASPDGPDTAYLEHPTLHKPFEADSFVNAVKRILLS